MKKILFYSVGLILVAGSHPASAQDPPETPAMSFFITSAGPGNGADLGGLEGADGHCQALAEAVGAGDRTWRAYLSTTAAGGAEAVHARDRIGTGPWYNARGVMVARDLDDLHSENNKPGKFAGHGRQRPLLLLCYQLIHCTTVPFATMRHAI